MVTYAILFSLRFGFSTAAVVIASSPESGAPGSRPAACVVDDTLCFSLNT